jgi:hypothetical protein
VIVTAPTFTAVTLPVASTVASFGLLEVNVGVTPAMAFPCAALALTFSVADWPTFRSAGAPSMVIAATSGCFTVTAMACFSAPAVAVTDVVPTPVAVTVLPVTSAILGSALLNATSAPFIGRPASSCTCASIVAVVPMPVRVMAPPLVTIFEGMTTATGTLALLSLPLTSTVVEPLLTEITVPWASTVATLLSAEENSNFTPSTGLPSAVTAETFRVSFCSPKRRRRARGVRQRPGRSG